MHADDKFIECLKYAGPAENYADIGSFGLAWDETDVTGYSDGVRNFTLGHPEAPIDISGVFNNTASTGSHTVFSSIDGDESQTYTVTVQVGIKATATTGDPEFEGEYICASYMVNGDGTFSARMVPGSSTAPAWGTVG